MTTMIRSAADILAEIRAAGDEPDVDFAIAVQPTPEATTQQRGQVRKGCPSERQYRRHLKNHEQCRHCSDYMTEVSRSRRERRRQRGGR